MTPSPESVSLPRPSLEGRASEIPAKRRKLSALDVTHPQPNPPEHGRTDRHEANKADSGDTIDTTDDGSDGGVPAHPFGVKPLGNAYDIDAPANIKTRAGGFAGLPDELLLHLLEYIQPAALLNLSGTCRALYAFCAAEEVWKALAVEHRLSKFSWRGTWRASFLQLHASRTLSPIACHGLFSDALYRSFFCGHTPLEPFTKTIPAKNQIARLEDLDSEEFNQKWANQPFILTEPVKQWPIYKQWSIEDLLENHGKTIFRAEAVTWPLSTYIAYMKSNSDETPLYLFDRRFVEKMGLTVGAENSRDTFPDYIPPACFQPDYFSVLGRHRPDSRWLILGPARSGSTFHKDPNGTSAWNAVIRGTKYWIMFPSTLPTTNGKRTQDLPPPPGVYPSPDGAHITTPFSIPEWLLNFHAAARATPGCKEGICREGEVLHVPSGWYHLVLNLEPGVAVTQNFVPRAHLGMVLGFLREKREQVSGFAEDAENPYALFVEELEREFPGLVREVEREGEDAGDLGVGKLRTKWEEITREGKDDSEKVGGGFSFGFSGDDVED